jgi:hypothetical protein
LLGANNVTERKDFRRWVAWLRREFRPCYPVRVLLLPTAKMPVAHDGYCTADENRRFTIKIRLGMSWPETQRVLQEEWAHMLRFHLWHVEGAEHDEIYGAIFNCIKAKWHE